MGRDMIIEIFWNFQTKIAWLKIQGCESIRADQSILRFKQFRKGEMFNDEYLDPKDSFKSYMISVASEYFGMD